MRNKFRRPRKLKKAMKLNKTTSKQFRKCINLLMAFQKKDMLAKITKALDLPFGMLETKHNL